nr:MAG TPA: hypothetical protein [Caudoviricetes sp.]
MEEKELNATPKAEDEVKLDELLGALADSDEGDTKDYLDENLILIDTEKLGDCKIDVQKFREGIESVSFLCGAITALVNVGINPNKAMNYLIDKEAAESAMQHNIDIANIQKETSIETSKLNFVDKVSTI